MTCSNMRGAWVTSKDAKLCAYVSSSLPERSVYYVGTELLQAAFDVGRMNNIILPAMAIAAPMGMVALAVVPAIIT